MTRRELVGNFFFANRIAELNMWMRNSFQNKPDFVRENRVRASYWTARSILKTTTRSAWSPRGAVFVDLSAAYDTVNRPTPHQQGARVDWRFTPDRPDTHHAGKQTLIRGAERDEGPLATTTKRTTTGKCTGTDVVQHLHQRPARRPTRRH